MATRPFVTLPVMWSLCLPLFALPAGAVETVTPHALETATSEDVASKEQTELQLLFEEKALVTATKRSTPLRKAPAIATIITADEIRNMGARTLVDVLRMVPGFGISFNEQGINQIEVRGIMTANDEKILVMIDGHPLNRTFGSAFYLLANALRREHRRVEVVRGPGSACSAAALSGYHQPSRAMRRSAASG
jgi:iron complex outermembrane receptor protein